jgi:nicotinamidase-related amidase
MSIAASTAAPRHALKEALLSATETPRFVKDWIDELHPVSFAEIAPEPERAAFFSADLINGFVHTGPLASPRILGIVDNVVDVFTRGWDYGIRDYVLLEDTHHPLTPEFHAYPPHALRDDHESNTIPELKALPFADSMILIEKNSLNPAIETGFDGWWDQNRHINRAIVVGDCTDLCVYQLAMHLRMRANALNMRDFEVIVAENLVQTFDIPEDGAAAGTAHPGDFFHDVFLYHMASNGIRVVSEITSGEEDGNS